MALSLRSDLEPLIFVISTRTGSRDVIEIYCEPYLFKPVDSMKSKVPDLKFSVL